MSFRSSTRITVPKVQARIFRLHEPKTLVGQVTDPEISPQRIAFVENTSMNIANGEGRIKGVQHERTALYGDVAELNIGEDPNLGIFESVIPNDHLEIFYRDVGDAGELGNPSGLVDIATRYLKDNIIFRRPPKFAGPIWKPEHVQKPSQVTTKLNAWGYMRIMQYYNIPRGHGISTRVRYLDMVESDNRTRTQRSDADVRSQNDLLDYIDHAIELYLAEMYGNDNPTVISDVQISSDEKDLKVKMLFNDLDVTFNKIHSGSGASAGIQRSSITDDYPKVTRIGTITNPEVALQLDNTIKGDVLHRKQISVSRFMDARVRIATSFDDTNDTARGPLFRVVGEVVAIDQFGLAQVLTGAITYDQGLHNWFTPLVDWDSDYLDRIESLNRGLSNKESIGRLVYIRFRAATINEDSSDTVGVRDLHRIAVFNRDSFGNFMDFITRAPQSNFHLLTQIRFFRGEGMKNDLEDFITGDIMRSPAFLSLMLSVVDFPQSQYRTPYTIFAGMEGSTHGDTLLDAIATGANLSTSLGALELFKELKTEYLKRATSYAALISSALRADDKLISFMTNIPASYMRADVFTGSKYKTFAYDSLSIIRVIQILSSTMGGFPATNNPVQATGSSGTNVDNYPIFLANRVIVTPEIIMAEKGPFRTYDGQFSFSRYIDGLFSTDSDNAQVIDKRPSGYFFLRLRVGLRLQKTDRRDVEFKIPVGDVNDLSIVKGAAINQIFTFSFAENMVFLKNFNFLENRVDNTRNTIETSKFHLEYRLGGQTEATSLTAAPPELNRVTLQDMTQQADYDPLFSRSQPNPAVVVKANGTEEYPVNEPHIAWLALKDDEETYSKGLVVTVPETKSNAEISKSDLALPSPPTGTVAEDISVTERLVGVDTYVDVTDLQKELSTLLRLATVDDIAYTELSNSRSKEKLLDLIKIRMPFEIKFEDDGFFRIPVEPDPSDELLSIAELLDDLQPFLQLSSQDMAWKLPLRGYYVSGLRTESEEQVTIKEQTMSYINTRFKPYMHNYATVAFLDLLVKGIRYVLWTLSKSRFLGHVYLPADHVKYAQGWEAKLGSIIKAATDNLVEPDIPTIDVGSAIIFDVEENNQLRKEITAGNVVSKIVNKVANVFNKTVNIAKKIITGTSSHSLTSMNVDGDDTALIWYVAKKTVYIGPDVGYMMRLNMTEGSFDWTLFYREDTMMTRISEYYLMNGIGNFFPLRGGV